MKKQSANELQRISVKTFKNTPKTPLIIILDNIRSLNNVGSFFRTSDAFLIKKIYLCGITACPPHIEIHKTALGATESVSWEYVEDIHELLKKLKQENTTILAVEQTTNSMLLNNYKTATSQCHALIFGNELKGVQQSVIDICDACIEVPQFGTKHSLNVSVCAGILCWHFHELLKN